MDVKLYVGNLSPETSEKALRTLFARAGTVASVTLIIDQGTGQSKGFAFVEMTTPAEAQKAIDMFNAYSLADRELKVNAAKPRSPGSVPGGYQSRYSAFGASNDGPTAPRRRDGNQRH